MFRGAYALAHGDVQEALAQARQAFSLRPLNFEVWQLLVRCYEALGDGRRLAYFEALCKKFYEVPLHLEMKQETIDAQLAMLTLGLGIGNYAPFAKARVQLRDGKLQTQRGLYAGASMSGRRSGSGSAAMKSARIWRRRAGSRNAAREIPDSSIVAARSSSLTR